MTIKAAQLGEKLESFETSPMFMKFWYGMLGVIGALALMYGYYLSGTVFNIVGRKVTEEEIRMLSSTVADLEVEYLTLDKAITLDKATELGFKEVSSSAHFAVRAPQAQALLVKNNEL